MNKDRHLTTYTKPIQIVHQILQNLYINPTCPSRKPLQTHHKRIRDNIQEGVIMLNGNLYVLILNYEVVQINQYGPFSL